MGKAQSKRSVDITTEIKDDNIVAEGTGKMGKIEEPDQVKPQINGNTCHNDSEKLDKDDVENEKDKITEKEQKIQTNPVKGEPDEKVGDSGGGGGGRCGTGDGGAMETTINKINENGNKTEAAAATTSSSSPSTTTNEKIVVTQSGGELNDKVDEIAEAAADQSSTIESIAADNSTTSSSSSTTKKSKKEKIKKRLSFRIFSFNKKDKQKPSKKEEASAAAEAAADTSADAETSAPTITTNGNTTSEVITNGIHDTVEEETTGDNNDPGKTITTTTTGTTAITATPSSSTTKEILTNGVQDNLESAKEDTVVVSTEAATPAVAETTPSPVTIASPPEKPLEEIVATTETVEKNDITTTITTEEVNKTVETPAEVEEQQQEPAVVAVTETVEIVAAEQSAVAEQPIKEETIKVIEVAIEEKPADVVTINDSEPESQTTTTTTPSSIAAEESSSNEIVVTKDVPVIETAIVEEPTPTVPAAVIGQQQPIEESKLTETEAVPAAPAAAAEVIVNEGNPIEVITDDNTTNIVQLSSSLESSPSTSSSTSNDSNSKSIPINSEIVVNTPLLSLTETTSAIIITTTSDPNNETVGGGEGNTQPPPLPINPPPSQAMVFAESAMATNDDLVVVTSPQSQSSLPPSSSPPPTVDKQPPLSNTIISSSVCADTHLIDNKIVEVGSNETTTTPITTTASDEQSSGVHQMNEENNNATLPIPPIVDGDNQIEKESIIEQESKKQQQENKEILIATQIEFESNLKSDDIHLENNDNLLVVADNDAAAMAAIAEPIIAQDIMNDAAGVESKTSKILVTDEIKPEQIADTIAFIEKLIDSDDIAAPHPELSCPPKSNEIIPENTIKLIPSSTEMKSDQVVNTKAATLDNVIIEEDKMKNLKDELVDGISIIDKITSPLVPVESELNNIIKSETPTAAEATVTAAEEASTNIVPIISEDNKQIIPSDVSIDTVTDTVVTDTDGNATENTILDGIKLENGTIPKMDSAKEQINDKSMDSNSSTTPPPPPQSSATIESKNKQNGSLVKQEEDPVVVVVDAAAIKDDSKQNGITEVSNSEIPKQTSDDDVVAVIADEKTIQMELENKAAIIGDIEKPIEKTLASTTIESAAAAAAATTTTTESPVSSTD